MGRKRLCKLHERKRAEKAERKLMESWLCVFSDDVFCPYSKVSQDNRVGSVCLSCKYYEKFEREMDEEDTRIMAEIDEILRTWRVEVDG